MNEPVRQVVIVGGGTAGWLSACAVAARADPAADRPIAVTLIESPDVATIGVGEGSWPTLRDTLSRIGIAEGEFLRACDATCKQGSRFDGWRTGGADDRYLHPFTPPVPGDPAGVVAGWRSGPDQPFATAVTPQATVCALDLAPRQVAMPDYAGALNYGYHLDAAKLAALLSRRARTLGVRHVAGHVVAVDRTPDGDIAAVRTRDGARIAGDLFLDCSGQAGLLIGDALGVPLVDRQDQLFNDRALAVQVPVAPDSPIASQTNATAHAAGWIWDIGLPTRRGVGCVYSSAHASESEAHEALTRYLGHTAPDVDAERLSVRALRFRSAHRARFWERNCLAVGLAAGFLEPLEASAIVLIELSLTALLDDWPTEAGAMALRARRFNERFAARWDRIVEFLKLHYVLSERPERYWRDHRDPATVPPRLADLLRLWRDRPPTPADLPLVDEVFPAASYQYVLYGMGAAAPVAGPLRAVPPVSLAAVERKARALASSLPTNRDHWTAVTRAGALEAAA